ncbi:MAG: hypothetical protein ACLPN5_10125 [Roseiarcus sp.]
MASRAERPKRMRSRLRSFAMQFTLALALVLGVAYAAIQPAAALPSFARQTGQPCATCHTAFPQLTPYGRRFKLMGYTATGGQYTFPPYPPLAFMLQSGFTHTNADLGPQGGAFNSPNNWTALDQQFSVFWGGRITDHLGAFVQVTRTDDGGGVAWGWDNSDVRYVITGDVAGHNVIWGLDFNNNPTIQDPWNTTSAWAWPFISSAFQPSPYAATLFDGPFGGLLGPGNAVSAGGYAFVDDSYYAELSLYKTPSYNLQSRLGVCCASDLLGNNITFDGAAPYWRFAIEKNIGAHSIMVGTYGMLADVIPNDISGFGTDKYWDEGFDSQYQWIQDKHAVTLRANYVIERQQFDNSFYSQGLTSNHVDYLESLKLQGEYVYDNTYSFGVGYFNISGTPDAGIYQNIGPNGNPSPNSAGWVFDVSYLPFSHGGPGLWPWANTRIGVSYTMFTRLDGLVKNVDSTPGLSASGNNTLFLYAFTMF